MKPSEVWIGLQVAFLGGDGREVEMAKLSVAAGARVVAYGTPEVSDQSVGSASTIEEALRGARVAVGPVPLPDADGRLYAPAAREPIYLTREALAGMDAHAHFVIGKASEDLHQAAREAGVTIHEYEHDTELMLLRAPAIAEGAIAAAIDRTPVTIHGSPIGVVGFGRTARVLVQRLIALGGRVHVFARRAEARAEAVAMGAEAHPLEASEDVFGSLDVIFSTVPAPVLTGEILSACRPGTTILDMAAPPGSVDGEAARARGLEFFWARGLGASAPRTVGGLQWEGVTRILRDALRG